MRLTPTLQVLNERPPNGRSRDTPALGRLLAPLGGRRRQECPGLPQRQPNPKKQRSLTATERIPSRTVACAAPSCPERLRLLISPTVGAMSASLIGHLGSSAFRLSTTAVSMSLTGSCFSSESAPRPFHHGIRRRGGTILDTALPSDERQVQADMRTHLIHRPARDIFPPLGGARVSSYRM